MAAQHVDDIPYEKLADKARSVEKYVKRYNQNTAANYGTNIIVQIFVAVPTNRNKAKVSSDHDKSDFTEKIRTLPIVSYSFAKAFIPDQEFEESFYQRGFLVQIDRKCFRHNQTGSFPIIFLIVVIKRSKLSKVIRHLAGNFENLSNQENH